VLLHSPPDAPKYSTTRIASRQWRSSGIIPASISIPATRQLLNPLLQCYPTLLREGGRIHLGGPLLRDAFHLSPFDDVETNSLATRARRRNRVYELLADELEKKGVRFAQYTIRNLGEFAYSKTPILLALGGVAKATSPVPRDITLADAALNRVVLATLPHCAKFDHQIRTMGISAFEASPETIRLSSPTRLKQNRKARWGRISLSSSRGKRLPGSM